MENKERQSSFRYLVFILTVLGEGCRSLRRIALVYKHLDSQGLQKVERAVAY